MLQQNLFGSHDLSEHVEAFIVDILEKRLQPSAQELLHWIDQELGLEARWDLAALITRLTNDPNLLRAERHYLQSMIDSGSLAEALRGTGGTDQHVASTIDNLMLQSQQYRSSKAFQEMIDFMGRFRDYAPYNNMLVRLQNPSCTFYATARDWRDRFDRTLKEDARPLLILAPMHPVMLVYELDQTEGGKLPKELDAFATFQGDWNPEWLSRILENTKRHRIRVDFKPLSSTHGGFATIAWGTGDWKMRIAVHNELDEPSRFGILSHELAHIFLGHLGTDQDNWWPSRTNLERDAIEVEAEAVAYIATSHLGLMGSSAAYVSRHLKSDDVPAAISLDLIAKVAGKIERMAKELIPAPRPKKRQETETVK
jgi:hypothetical protein